VRVLGTDIFNFDALQSVGISLITEFEVLSRYGTVLITQINKLVLLENLDSRLKVSANVSEELQKRKRSLETSVMDLSIAAKSPIYNHIYVKLLLDTQISIAKYLDEVALNLRSIANKIDSEDAN
jgi:hypothetical protein